MTIRTDDLPFHLLYVTVFSGCLLSVSSQTVSTPGENFLKNPGETVYLPCSISGVSGSDALVWKKSQGQADEFYTITEGQENLRSFPSRYSATIDIDSEGNHLYRLSIADLGAVDDGKYRCEVRRAGSVVAYVEHKLSVYAAIESVRLAGTTNSSIQPGQNYSSEIAVFRQGAGNGYLLCEVTGGSPEPDVTVQVVPRDSSAEPFRVDMTMSRGVRLDGSTPGLQVRTVVTRLETKTFDLEAKYFGCNITCEASVTDKEGQEKYSKDATLWAFVTSAPFFLPNHEFQGEVGDCNFVVTVVIRSFPFLKSAIWRKILDNGDKVLVDSDKTSYKLDYSVGSLEINYNSSMAFDLLTRNDFGLYEIEATNEYGTTRSEIWLYEGPRNDKGRPENNTSHVPGITSQAKTLYIKLHNESDPVTLDCVYQGKDSNTQFMWSKAQAGLPDHPEYVPLSYMQNVQHPFQGRYSVQETKTCEGMSFRLTITAPREEDWGLYACYMSDHQGNTISSVQHTLHFYRRINHISLTGTSDSRSPVVSSSPRKSLYYVPGTEWGYLSCKVTGGGPDVKVKLTKAHQNITSPVRYSEDKQLIGNTKGLQKPMVIKKFETHRLRIVEKDKYSSVTCLAWVSYHDSYRRFDTKASSKIIFFISGTQVVRPSIYAMFVLLLLITKAVTF